MFAGSSAHRGTRFPVRWLRLPHELKTTFKRILFHSAGETSAILSRLTQQIHVNCFTCVSKPPAQGDRGGKRGQAVCNHRYLSAALPSYLSACSASLAWYTKFSLSAMVLGYWGFSWRPSGKGGLSAALRFLVVDQQQHCRFAEPKSHR